MSISTYRNVIVQSIICITGLVGCQSVVSDKKTDSVARLAIHYLNTNKPDSFYQDCNRRRVQETYHANFDTQYVQR